MGWLRNLLEWQDTSNPQEFVNALKLDAFSDEVFVFTPRGDVIDLPQGAIPIDFAYRIHTDVGHRCVGAKVNGKIVPLDYALKNGDIVEVITSKTGKPSLDWLKIVGSSESRSKIRNWFKKENRMPVRKMIYWLLSVTAGLPSIRFLLSSWNCIKNWIELMTSRMKNRLLKSSSRVKHRDTIIREFS